MDTGQSDEIFRDTWLRASILQTFERKCGNNAPINVSTIHIYIYTRITP